MTESNYKRTNRYTELVSVCILVIQFFLIFTDSKLSTTLPPLIINIFLYSVLTTVFYFSYSPKLIFKPIENKVAFGERTSLSSIEAIKYLNKSVLFIGLLKACYSSILFALSIISILEIAPFPFFQIFVVFIILAISFYFLFNSIKYLIKANGFINATNKQVVLNGLLYYNPNDNRAIVEKQFGMGTTVNFASKQGRLLLWVLLSIPITMFTLLIIVLMISGKI